MAVSNAIRKWQRYPFIHGSTTPTERKYWQTKIKTCRHCGSVTIIGGNKIRESRLYENFFCDIVCANEYKTWHNKSASYLARWAESEHAKSIVEQRLERQSAQDERRKLHKGWTCCSWCGKAIDRLGMCCSTECSTRRSRCLYKQSMRLKYQSDCTLRHGVCMWCSSEFTYKQHKSKASGKRRFCGAGCARKSEKNNRRHRIRTNGDVDIIGTITLAKKTRWRCAQCNVKCKRPDGSNDNHEATLDHIHPLSKGGTHTWDNVQLLCRQCNTIKRDQVVQHVNNRQLLLF